MLKVFFTQDSEVEDLFCDASLCSQHSLFFSDNIRWNFNGSNTYGTMKISWKQGWFEPMRVDYCARLDALYGYLLDFL